MDQNIKSFITQELNDSVILEKPDVTYPGIKIVEYRTYHENGKKFTHANGDNYALSFLNAFTKKGYEKVADAIKADVNIENLKKVVEENRLKQYIHSNTKPYSEWMTGDLGKAYLIKVKKSDDLELAGFSNITAEKRIQN